MCGGEKVPSPAQWVGKYGKNVTIIDHNGRKAESDPCKDADRDQNVRESKSDVAMAHRSPREEVGPCRDKPEETWKHDEGRTPEYGKVYEKWDNLSTFSHIGGVFDKTPVARHDHAERHGHYDHDDHIE